MSLCHTYGWVCQYCATHDLPACKDPAIVALCAGCSAPSPDHIAQEAQKIGLALHFCARDASPPACNMAYHCSDAQCRARTLRHVGTTATSGQHVTSYLGAHLQDLGATEQAAVLCHEMGHNLNLKEALGGITLAGPHAEQLSSIRQDAGCPSGIEAPSPGGCNHEFLADQVCSTMLLPALAQGKHLVYRVKSDPYRYMDTLVDSAVYATQTCKIRATEGWHVDADPPARCAGKPYVDHFNHPPVDPQ